MKSSMNSKQNSSTSPKSKKSSKERDKRRPEYGQTTIDPPQLIEIAFMGETKRYARLGRESVLNYAEQSINELPSNEISYSLAEDLSYKLRNIIHDALIKAHLSGRTCLMSSDVDATFENLSLDKVYGASNSCNFIPFTEKNLYYLDDTIVNIVDLAEETGTVIQPGNVLLTKRVYPEVTASTSHFVSYFDTMCRSLISSTPKLQQEALRDIRRNQRIGPIVNWFYHFGYFLLSKDITYDSLTLSALDLIRALEENWVAIQLVSEKELKLLVRLILQRLLRTPTTTEVIKPMCNVLVMLCTRLPLRELVMKKISQRMQEIKSTYALAQISIINELGADAVEVLLCPELRYFLLLLCNNRQKAKHSVLSSIERTANDHLELALMRTYRLLCVANADIKYHWAFYEVYNYGLLPLWMPNCACTTEKLESNWRNIKAQLLKSRRRIQPTARKQTSKPCIVHDVFEHEDEVASGVGNKVKLQFKASQNVFPVRSEQPFKIEKSHFVTSPCETKYELVVIGRRSTYFTDRKAPSCLDHTSLII